jgi:hypothetical protein
VHGGTAFGVPIKLEDLGNLSQKHSACVDDFAQINQVSILIEGKLFDFVSHSNLEGCLQSSPTVCIFQPINQLLARDIGESISPEHAVRHFKHVWRVHPKEDEWHMLRLERSALDTEAEQVF